MSHREPSIWQIFAAIAWMQPTGVVRVMQMCDADAGILFQCDGRAVVIWTGEEDDVELKEAMDTAIHDCLYGLQTGPLRRQFEPHVAALMEKMILEESKDAAAADLQQQIDDAGIRWVRPTEKAEA